MEILKANIITDIEHCNEINKNLNKGLSPYQICVLNNMTEYFSYINGLNNSLKFLEEELGMVHNITIKFRNKIKEAQDEYKKLTELVRSCGAFDIIIKNI